MNHSTKSLLTGAMLVAALLFVATAAFAQGITIDLGKTETGRYMNLVGNTPGSDGEINSNVYIAPEYCATNKGSAMFFNIADGFFYQLSAGKFVLVNVEYYDAPGVQVKLVYDAQSNHAGKEHPDAITTTGSNKWRSKSFVIDDAYFGNGLTHGADLKLVAASGTMTINAVSVVPFEAYYDYGSTPDSLFLAVREYQGGDSKTQIVTKEGEECVASQGTLSDQYLYLAVDDSLIYGGNHPYVFVAVEYYDQDPSFSMRLQYDDATSANHYRSTAYVFNKGWGSFRTYTFEIPDAWFANRENGQSDMRLQIAKAGLAVNRVLIGRLDKKPLPATNNIANFTAYKALESPTVDGKLIDWSWLGPYGVNPLFAGDGSRTDEFYRTWLLNNANVPIVEPGEPGVTDPGVPGMWDVKDLSGGVSALWDDQKLYFSVNVKDNVVSTSNAAWTGQDGFGFFIDVSHTYSPSNAPVAIKDNPTFQQGEHFFFFPAEQGKAGIWRHSTSQDGEAMPAGVTKSVVKTDSGYIIEASVPLSVIADGLTWKPGVIGDKDAFNPLFAWMINDNDGIGASSGRVMCGGNSEDDEFWGTLNMNPIPLVDRGLMIDLGTKNYESFVKQVETQVGGDGVTTPVERGGKTGVMLNSGYLYLDVNDTVFNAAKHPHLLVSVEYYDSAMTNSRFRLQYDADTAAYVSLPYVYLGGTKAWKTVTFELKNARFESRQNGRADFRIATSSSTKDVVINQVKVAMADLWIDLGDTTVGYGMNETQLASDGLRTPVTVGGVNCKRNDMGYGNAARYFYHAVNDSAIYNGNHQAVFVTVEYYDTSSSGGIGMNYDGMSNKWSNAIGDAFITGSSQWKLHSFFLPDAKFSNAENGQSDFRITGNGNGTTFVNRILVGSLDSLKTITSVAGRQTAPFTFVLDQNYPNPFNPTTMISYTLPSSGRVSLKIYNLIGQEVATLVNTDQVAGRHSIRWDASRLSSGAYFCRLVHNNSSVLVKKLMLLK